MFNLGGDDKEKLKENMEEIKDLVNSQHAGNSEINSEPNHQPPEEKPEPDVPDELDGDLSSQIKSAQQLDLDEPQEEPKQNKSRNSSRENSDNDLRNDLKSISNEVKKMDKPKGSKTKSSSQNQHKSMSRPSGDGETVFLEVDEFQDVKGKVEEMRYLSREIKDLVGNLEEGVDEDRRIESEAQDVLNDFADRRESIQNSIK